MQPLKNTSPDDINEKRRQVREDFLADLGWNHVTLEPMQADASFRRYYRMKGTDTPMLLMQDPPDRPPIPPYVMVEPFIEIAEHLHDIGLRTPVIHHRKVEDGLLVIEDFGDDTYTRLFNKGMDPEPLYELAVDALAHLHQHPDRNNVKVPQYDDKMLVDEAMLLLDWYYPALSGKKPTDEMKESFGKVWKDLFAKFPQGQQTLVLRDYHVDNLMLTKDGAGIGRCGLLDFQDAVIGQFSYDLMSLLEDARRDVPKDLKQKLYDRYMDQMGEGLDKEGFDYSFKVLAAQRHAKVLGIFIRLSVRDGKERYLQFIPHVHNLFTQALESPHLAPLRQWFEDNQIDIRAQLKQPEPEKPKGPQP